MGDKIPFGQLHSVGRRKVVMHHAHLIGNPVGLLRDGDLLFLDDALESQYQWLMLNENALYEKGIHVVLGISPGLARRHGRRPSSPLKSAELHDAFHAAMERESESEMDMARDGFMSFDEIRKALEIPFVYPANHGYNHLDMSGWEKDVLGAFRAFKVDVSCASAAFQYEGMENPDIFVFPYDLELPGARRWLANFGFKYVFGGPRSDRIEIEDLAALKDGRP